MNKLASAAIMFFLSISISACSVVQSSSSIGPASCGQTTENSPAIRECAQPRLGWKGADGSAYRMGG